MNKYTAYFFVYFKYFFIRPLTEGKESRYTNYNEFS